jgi:hypothetical protein
MIKTERLLRLVLILACMALALGFTEEWPAVQVVAALAILPLVAIIAYRMVVRSLLAAG